MQPQKKAINFNTSNSLAQSLGLGKAITNQIPIKPKAAGAKQIYSTNAH